MTYLFQSTYRLQRRVFILIDSEGSEYPQDRHSSSHESLTLFLISLHSSPHPEHYNASAYLLSFLTSLIHFDHEIAKRVHENRNRLFSPLPKLLFLREAEGRVQVAVKSEGTETGHRMSCYESAIQNPKGNIVDEDK